MYGDSLQIEFVRSSFSEVDLKELSTTLVLVALNRNGSKGGIRFILGILEYKKARQLEIYGHFLQGIRIWHLHNV